MDDASRLGRTAVVIGASVAGLLAARVLQDRFDTVVLVERDRLPAGPAPRKGTPHAAHPHGLLARGREVLEALFPGFTQALLDQGAVGGDMQRDVAFVAGRHRLAAGVCGHGGLGVSRLALEAELRRRVRALPRVQLRDGVELLAPITADGGHSVIGVRVQADGGEPEALAADLVVDCSGRASRTPAWLSSWGFAPPAEERVEIGLVYASAWFRREGALAQGAGVAVTALVGSATADQPRPSVLIAQEPGADGVPRWVLGVGGYRGDHPQATPEGLCERAAALGIPELLRVAQDGRREGEVMRYHFAHSLRRHYERLKRFPAGYLVMGDAIASFNPVYGQGMTVAACEALALREALADGLEGLAPRFFRRAARVIDVPWQLAVGGDLSIDAVPGQRPLVVRLLNAYVARLQRAAVHDAALAWAFVRVVNLLAPPQSLFAPRVLWRVLVGAHRPAAAPVAVATLFRS